MKTVRCIGLGVVLALILACAMGERSNAQSPSRHSSVNSEPKVEKGAVMHASGPFDVKIVPQPGDDDSVGRLSIDKHYHGELDATGTGQMLTGGDYKSGSAGYVAMEKITGTLQGRRGSFIVQHSGTLTQGAQQLTITIVPGTGTGQLTGITGKMDVKINDGKHLYELDYTLPESN
jgi:Protein of unknown function (DUF3224)